MTDLKEIPRVTTITMGAGDAAMVIRSDGTVQLQVPMHDPNNNQRLVGEVLLCYIFQRVMSDPNWAANFLQSEGVLFKDGNQNAPTTPTLQ